MSKMRILGLSMIVLVAGSCNTDLSLANYECPCIEGWTCCETTQTCVADQVECRAAEVESTPCTVSDPDCTKFEPLGWWSFEETTGGQAIDTLGAHHGVLHEFVDEENPTWVSGVKGQALHFSGHNFVAIEQLSPLVSDQDFSLSLWAWMDIDKSKMYPTMFCDADWIGGAPEGEQYIPGFQLQYHKKEKEVLSFNIGTDNSSDPNWFKGEDFSPRERWVHIVATYDGTHSRIYIDSVLAKTQAAEFAPIDPLVGKEIFIGKSRVNGPESNFVGSLDEVRLYGVTLSVDDVGVLHRESNPYD